MNNEINIINYNYDCLISDVLNFEIGNINDDDNIYYMNMSLDEVNIKFKETKDILQKVSENLAIEYAIWMKNKAKIKFENKIPTFPITSNYIYWCDLGINIGSEQNKIRPVLIVKTKKESLVCTVLPLTSERMNDTRWYHIDLENQNSTVLVEQLRNVSKLRIINPFRLKGKIGKITLNDWEKINLAMKKYYAMTKWQ